VVSLYFALYFGGTIADNHKNNYNISAVAGMLFPPQLLWPIDIDGFPCEHELPVL
jgi:hypothetical protein